VIFFRQFKLQDWIDIDAVEPFCPRFPTDEFSKAVKNGFAVTAVRDDKIMACGGLVFAAEPVVWLKVAKNCYSLALAKAIIDTAKIIREIVDAPIYTYILEDFKKSERLAKIIGFEKTSERFEYENRFYRKYVL